MKTAKSNNPKLHWRTLAVILTIAMTGVLYAQTTNIPDYACESGTDFTACTDPTDCSGTCVEFQMDEEIDSCVTAPGSTCPGVSGSPVPCTVYSGNCIPNPWGRRLGLGTCACDQSGGSFQGSSTANCSGA